MIHNQALNGLPTIVKKETITTGNGDTIERSTASGTPDFRLFDVGSGGSLTLENLTCKTVLVRFGNLSGSAAPICNHGNLTFHRLTLSGNGGDSGDGGGGIYNDGTATVTGGTLPGTTPTSTAVASPTRARCSSTGLQSGQLRQVRIRRSRSAGHLVQRVADLGERTLLQETCRGAPARDGLSGFPGTVGTNAYGGAVYVAGGTVTITSTTITQNNAFAGVNSVGGLFGGNAFGGALYIAAERVSLSTSTVSNNQVPITWDGELGNGGGLYVAGGTVTLTNDTVESNFAADYGGGIYIAAGTVYIDPSTVTNTTNNTDGTGLNGTTANIDGTYNAT